MPEDDYVAVSLALLQAIRQVGNAPLGVPVLVAELDPLVDIFTVDQALVRDLDPP